MEAKRIEVSRKESTGHWSNEEETIELIKHIINQRAIAARKEMGLPKNQKALLIWDVFKGQCTDKVNALLEKLNVKVVTVPANMRKKFVTWYAEEVKRKIEEGTPTEHMEVNFNLTRLKPIHAGWMIEMYNFLTSEEGRVTILNGWKKAGIAGVIKKTEVPPKDPFV